MPTKKMFIHVARIIRDGQDSLDRLMPLEQASRLWDEGKLVHVDIGPAYPYSFQEVVHG